LADQSLKGSMWCQECRVPAVPCGKIFRQMTSSGI
jgi:hypothetical protein